VRKRKRPIRIALVGPLPGNRRLTKPLIVRVVWDNEYWLVTEPTYHIHTVGPTVRKAVAQFRHLLCDYLDGLNDREDRLSQHLTDQLAYLREMIQEHKIV
jgi:hypothetical protein